MTKFCSLIEYADHFVETMAFGPREHFQTDSKLRLTRATLGFIAEISELNLALMRQDEAEILSEKSDVIFWYAALSTVHPSIWPSVFPSKGLLTDMSDSAEKATRLDIIRSPEKRHNDIIRVYSIAKYIVNDHFSGSGEIIQVANYNYNKLTNRHGHIVKEC